MTPKARLSIKNITEPIVGSIPVADSVFGSALNGAASHMVTKLNLFDDTSGISEASIVGSAWDGITGWRAASLDVRVASHDVRNLLTAEDLYRSSLVPPSAIYTDDELLAFYGSAEYVKTPTSLWEEFLVKPKTVTSVADAGYYYHLNTEPLTWKDLVARITRFVKDTLVTVENFFEVAVYWLSYYAKIFFVLSKPTILLN